VFKQLLLPLFIFTTFLSSEELTFSEKVSASFLNGVVEGITGIGNKLIDFNLSKMLSNMDKLKEEQKVKREIWKEKEIKRLKKSLKSISAERYKYIHLYSQEKEKNRELQKRVAQLEKLITQYHIEENNKISARVKAKEDLRKQLKGSHE